MRLLDPGSLTRHTNRLYRAAWALCGSREDAEDLVQETFVRVLARPRMLRDEEAELAYLLRVLRNTFLTGRRDASRRPVTVATLEEVVATEPRPSLAPEKAREVGEVYEAIAELPEHFRSALVAVDLVGLSYREAARASRCVKRRSPRASSAPAACWPSASPRSPRLRRRAPRTPAERVAAEKTPRG